MILKEKNFAYIDISEYDQAIIISSDGDFYSLISHLISENKLRAVIATDEHNCSSLLKNSAKSKLTYIHDLRKKLECTLS